MLEQNESSKMAEEVGRLLFEVNAVSINTEKLFKFVSGILSPIYIDNRKLISYPKARKMIVSFFVEALQKSFDDEKFDTIAGVATGGIPWAAWIANDLQLPMIYVRPTPKERGLQQQVEGVLRPGEKVIVVEDLVTTGLSSSNVADVIRNQGGIANHCVAIFSFQSPSAVEKYRSHNLEAFTLTNLSSLLSVARKEKHISSTQADDIEKWAHTTLV